MAFITEKPQSISLEQLRAPVAAGLASLDRLIAVELASSIPLIETITDHILQSGGKRLRPLLVLLMAQAAGVDNPATTLHTELAAVIEFMHTATLLHDDVVDNSTLRRGKKTANTLWGNEASVLIGDFLYARSFEILTRHQRHDILGVISKSTRLIVEGEVLQLMHREDAHINLKQYLNVIERKTAQLFISAAEVGALTATQETAVIKAAGEYGYHIGMVFQMMDDVLDYTADKKTLGKNVGDDAAEGKYTLPVVLALREANPKDAVAIQEILREGTATACQKLHSLFDKYNAFHHCYEFAKKEAAAALHTLSIFPDTPYRQSLQDLVHFALERNY